MSNQRVSAVAALDPLLGVARPPGHRWETEIGVERFPRFADHRLQGTIVLPGSAYLEMALAAVTAVEGHAPSVVADLAFERAFVVSSAGTRALQLVLSRAPNGDWSFAATGSNVTILHARARLPVENSAGEGAYVAGLNPADPAWAEGIEIAGDALYARLRARGNEFGPAYQHLEYCRVRDGAAVGVLRVPATGPRLGQFLRAAVLDTAMQVLTAAADGGDDTLALVGCERLRLHRTPGTANRVLARMRAGRNPDGDLIGDALVVDDTGHVMVELTGVRLRALLWPSDVARARSLPGGRTPITVAVAATFTADPIEEPLAFWLDTLGVPATIKLAPYNQPFQQLLDRTSLLSQNGSGVNVLLVRCEDLARRLAPRAPSRPVALAGDSPRLTLPGVGEIAHLVPYETEFLYREIFVQESYLRHGIELGDGACVFDVGANIGLFTLFVHSRCDNARVFAFEPAPPVCDILRRNTAAHAPSTHVFDCGLGDENAERPFTYYPRSPTFSGFAADAARDHAALAAVVGNVVRGQLPAGSPDLDPLVEQLTHGRLDRRIYRRPVRTLSDVVREHAIERIDLLKIDAEGSERAVLAGIADEHWPLVRQLVVEVHDPTDAEHLRALLAERGFDVVLDSSDELLRRTGFVQVFARRPGAATATRRTWTADLERDADDLLRAIAAAQPASRVPLIVGLCPRSAAMQADAVAGDVLDRVEQRLADGLAELPGVVAIPPADVERLYPVPGYADARAEELGRIPYSRRYFAALGTMIARRYLALVEPPVKVLALDCDGVLWDGVCGEDGPAGVRIDAARRALQEWAVRQHDAGTLICLCSKNNAADVYAVFAQRTDMPLTLAHVAASRIGWEAKSGNLASLAAELGLGLDSFVFVDNDPLECAEVRAHRPEVLTLCLPADAKEIPRFLAHVWAFDRLRVTDEDRARGARVRQEQVRRASREISLTLAAFVDGLDVRVEINPLARAELRRAAQLTARTNQFNATAIHRSEAALQALLEPDRIEGRTVRVRDRFGDYGLVGVTLFDVHDAALRVDTFLLSCRALGRGVEHRMLAALGNIARERRLDKVRLRFLPTGKNEPARRFFASVADATRSDDNGVWFEIAAEHAAALVFNPSATTDEPGERREAEAPPAMRRLSSLQQRIAGDLATVDAVVEAVERGRGRTRPALRTAFAGPDDEVERALVNLWRRVLGIDEVGIDDNFFELGGTSLRAVQVMAELSQQSGAALPTVGVFEHTTIRALAAMLRACDDDAGLAGQRRGQRRRQRQLQ
jgi:FkbH-like protein/FkbM family methyltransferase